MARYLMTQSLISAWAYCFDCCEGSEEEAWGAFLRVLRREPSEPTKAMQNGLDFEREVYKAAAGVSRPLHEKWEQGIQAAARMLRGAQVQVRVSREIQVEGMTFLVYGVLDALKAGVIYDVKFLNKSFANVELAGKYLDSAQHPFYFYLVPEAYEFNYLVSDGEDLYKETYYRGQVRSTEEIIQEFIHSISEYGLLPLYQEKWLAKEKGHTDVK